MLLEQEFKDTYLKMLQHLMYIWQASFLLRYTFGKIINKL
jgi:hypothetical protein